MDRFGRRPVLSSASSSARRAAPSPRSGRTSVDRAVDRRLRPHRRRRARARCSSAPRRATCIRRERRARGISYVLFGSVFGAILGPTVFSPLFAGKHARGGASSRVPWLAASAHQRRLVAFVLARPAGPEADRASCSAAPRTASPAAAARAASRDHPPPRGDPRDARCVRELRRDGLGDEPHGLRRRREAPPPAARRVPDHRRARARDVRARPLRRALSTASDARPRSPPGLLVMGASALALGWMSSVVADGGAPLRPRDRLEHLLRRGRRSARRPDAARPSAGGSSASTTSPRRSSAASLALVGGLTLETSASRRWRSARRSS